MDFNQLKRMESVPEPDDNQPVEVIVHVKRANYAPKVLKVRAWIDKKIFTAATTMGVVRQLREDPRVVSVQTSEPLRMIE